jgi:hypothetical protein
MQQVDSWLFEEALREGRAALDRDEPDKAAERLRDGLALWRGPAFADVEGAAVEREAARLDQQRLLALDLRIQADLALGRHAELVGELEQLVGEYPWQEQFIAHLMLALYRCGRQADALAVYRDAYDRLLNEVGVSPGPALQELHQRVLRQDPALEPAATGVEATRAGARHPAAPDPSTAPVAASAPRTRRRLLVAAAVVVAAVMSAGTAGLHAAGVAPWQATQGPRPSPSRRAPPGSVFNQFDLRVRPGIGYDLDIPPGRPSDWHAAWDSRSPNYEYLDFYRTSPGARAGGGQISGVSLTNNDADFNAIHKINPDQPATACLGLTEPGPWVAMSDLHVGDKVCLHTHENRWALITVTRMPSEPDALLFVHATVLNP